jgi:hypothetical protein
MNMKLSGRCYELSLLMLAIYMGVSYVAGQHEVIERIIDGVKNAF